MSLTHLCLSILALSPELSATLIAGLLAAVPVVAGETDPEKRRATLISEMNGLHPRDLEEAILASQFLTAHHNAQACFDALTSLDPASREASRLRRDAMAMQRVVIAMHRTLQASKSRPMLQDAEGGEPRPTVPVRLPNSGQGKVKENRPVAAAAAASKPDAAAARRWPTRAELFGHDPSLLRLAENWHKLKRWEDMTMEERRETFGYKYDPNPSDQSDGNGTAAAGSGKTGVPRTAA